MNIFKILPFIVIFLSSCDHLEKKIENIEEDKINRKRDIRTKEEVLKIFTT